MTGTFRTRIPTLSEDELRHYLAHPLEYRIEAVEAAVAELRRRGQPIREDAWAEIRRELQQRDAAAHPGPGRLWGAVLGRSLASRTARIRLITAGILVAGLGSATAIYLTAGPKAGNPLGYEPEDTKKYLRDLELYGGKVNVLATEFMRWWDGLWHGRTLAFTLAWLTMLLALGFWFVATRLSSNLDPMPGDDPGPSGNGAPGHR